MPKGSPDLALDAATPLSCEVRLVGFRILFVVGNEAGGPLYTRDRCKARLKEQSASPLDLRSVGTPWQIKHHQGVGQNIQGAARSLREKVAGAAGMAPAISHVDNRGGVLRNGWVMGKQGHCAHVAGSCGNQQPMEWGAVYGRERCNAQGVSGSYR